MDVTHVGLVHHNPCKCKVKGFRVVSSIERNVSMKHLQGVLHVRPRLEFHQKTSSCPVLSTSNEPTV